MPEWSGSRLQSAVTPVRFRPAVLCSDNRRWEAYTRSVSLREQEDTTRAASPLNPIRRRRRPPNQVEQWKREAWGRFWGNANKGAMKR